MPDFKHDDERRTGLYATLAFHLSVLIILLLVSIGSVVDKEHSFVLDFTKQEEREKEIKQMEMKEEAKRQIDELLGRPAPRVRNVAVDAGDRLRDNKGRTGSDVYKEARDLQRKLDASKRDALLTKAVTAAPDAFDAEFDAGMADYLASGGQAIIDERIEKLAEVYGIQYEK